LDTLKRFFKETAIYSGFDFLRRLIGFFLIPFYTRVLTPTEYGTFFIINLVLGFLAIIYNLGLSVSLYRFQPKRDDTFANGIYFLIPFSAILSIIFISLSPRLAGFFLHDSSLGHLFQIGIIFLFFEGILNQILSFYKIKREATRFGIISTFRFASGLLLNIIFVVILRRGVAGILIGNALAAIVISLIAFFYVHKFFKGKFDKGFLLDQLNYSLPLLPAFFAFFLIDFIDRFMIERFTNLSEVGVYSLAYQFGTVINLVILGYRTAYAPYFFSLPEDKQSELSRAFRYFVLATGYLYILWILLLPLVFKIFVGFPFQRAMALVWTIALGFVAYGIYVNFASHLYLRNKTGLVSILATTALTANIVFNLILIPPFGIYGAAWATLIAYGLLASLTYFITRPEGYDLSILVKVLILVLLAVIFSIFNANIILRLILIIGYPVLVIILEPDIKRAFGN